MALSSEPTILSQPCDVDFAGWKASTIALQQAGWQLAVEQASYEYHVRLLLHHARYQLTAVSHPVDADAFWTGHRYRPGYRPLFVVTGIARAMGWYGLESPLDRVMAIDALPQHGELKLDRREMDIENIFATPLARTEEIIVEPQDVASMLEQIRRMQSPEMAEIRKREQRRARDEAGPREVIHAQILSFAK